jgi:hypothetical protein
MRLNGTGTRGLRSRVTDTSGGTSIEAAAVATTAASERRFRGLRRYNLVAAGFHALQAVAVVLLSNGFTLPVTPGNPVPFENSVSATRPAHTR